MKQIAQELIRLAKELVGESYPFGATEKTKAIIDDCRLCLEAKQIYNAKFNDYKHSLTGNLESYGGYLNKTGNMSRAVFLYGYKYEFLVNSFTELPKGIRNLEKVLSKKAFPEEILENAHESDIEAIKAAWPKALEDQLSILKSWLPVKQLLDELKPLIVKGRAPAAPDPNKFVAPRSSTSVISFVTDELKKLVDPLVSGLEKSLIEDSIKVVEEVDQKIVKYLEDHPEKGGRADIAARAVIGEDGQLRQLCYKTIGGIGGGSSYKGLNKDYKEEIGKIVRTEIKDMVEAFIAKNSGKISPIISLKGKLKGAKILKGHLAGFGFWGEILFDFTDGTEFTVRNKMVRKWNYSGVFYQFPTTFHDVKFPDGKVRAMLSEQEMNQDWASLK
jgi:hypothetical protein